MLPWRDVQSQWARMAIPASAWVLTDEQKYWLFIVATHAIGGTKMRQQCGDLAAYMLGAHQLHAQGRASIYDILPCSQVYAFVLYVVLFSVAVCPCEVYSQAIAKMLQPCPGAEFHTQVSRAGTCHECPGLCQEL